MPDIKSANFDQGYCRLGLWICFWSLSAATVLGQNDPASAESHRVIALERRQATEVEQFLTDARILGQFDLRFFQSSGRGRDSNWNSDGGSGREITLVGNSSEVQFAAELVQRFDRWNLDASGYTAQIYPTAAASLWTTAEQWRQEFDSCEGLLIRVDGIAKQLLVFAPQEVHASLQEQSNSVVAGSSRQIARPGLTESAGWQSIELRTADPEVVKQTLENLFSARSTTSRVDDGRIYVAALPEAETFQFGWPNRGSEIHFQGSAASVAAFRRLVSALDRVGRDSLSASFLSIRHASMAAVGSVCQAWGVVPPGTGPAELDASTVPGRSVSFARIRGGQDPIQAPETPPLLPGETPLQESDPLAQRQEQLLRELRDSVQVETLPELGIIILRGRQKEVEELSRIIQELERLSAETQPEIKIIELRHTRGDAIQKIIQTTSADLVSARQGRVTVTPLIKPNALLLVGWGEAVAIVSELIARLDQPVDADSQFEVFRLTHASVTQLQTSLTAFFANREGLGPKLQIVGDARSNSIVVYASPRDMEEVQRLVQELDVPNYRKRQQAKVLRVENALASELATTLQNAIKAARGTGPQQAAMLELLAIDSQGEQVLRSGVLDQVEVTPNPVNNSLILSGPPESMELMEALVEQLDVVGSTAQIKVFRIEHGDAANLVQMLRSLLPAETSAQPNLKLSSDAEEPSLAPLRFSIDTRTNSIIATGSEGDLRIIEALLLRLDEKEFSQRRNTVYRLKNAPATDVALAINNFLRSERQAQNVSPATLSPFEQIEREVVVVPEPIGNRLIVSATPRYFEEIENLIEQLDEPPPQVMIQVLIAEVTLDNAKEFGVELGLQDSILFDRSLLGSLITTTKTTQTSTPAGIVTTNEQVIQAASNEPGFNFNNVPLGNSGSAKSLSTSNQLGGQGLSSFALGRVNNELGFGGLVLSASNESISVLIRALEECRRLEVLSRPQIRTLDNQPAFIQVGQRVPRIIGSTVNQAGQSNTVALENVGLILGVTPRISPDGAVVMEIDAERSALGPEADGIPVSISPNGNIIRSPRIDTTTAQATVSASSGETIILGGLITKRAQSIRRRVPLLSDLPLLGNFFRYDSDIEKRTELLIILTPFVIRGAEDEYRLKQAEYARMSWCASDVCEIHGDIGGDYLQTPWVEDHPDTSVVYPDSNPGDPGSVNRSGNLPAELPLADPHSSALQPARLPFEK